MNKADRNKADALAHLHEILQPGSTVYTQVLHVSRSGMQREVSCHIVLRDGSIGQITHTVADAIGHRLGKNGGIMMGGCGMDMCFHAVYLLGQAMWPGGTPAPHGMRNGEADSTGGYALKQRSL
jgi:hypothetical protein